MARNVFLDNLDFLDTSIYRVQQISGFISYKDDRPVSQQFRLFNYCSQDVYIRVISENSAFSTRIITAHKPFDSDRCKSVGFTTDKCGETGYDGICRWNCGVIYLSPVHFPGTHLSIRSRRECQMLMIKGEPDVVVEFTHNAEAAAEELFRALDADSNWYLSKREISVFKERLGCKFEITDEEWDEIREGWGEGDLNENGEISFQRFKTFLLRIAEGSFTFKEIKSAGTPKKKVGIQRQRETLDLFWETDTAMRQMFTKLGFDCNLLSQSKVGNFTVYISSRRGSKSNLVCLPMDRIKIDRALLGVSFLLGDHYLVEDSNLRLCIFKADDFSSICVINGSEESVEPVEIDFRKSKHVRTLASGIDDGLLWKTELQPLQNKIALCFVQDLDTEEKMSLKGTISFESAQERKMTTLRLPHFD